MQAKFLTMQSYKKFDGMVYIGKRNTRPVSVVYFYPETGRPIGSDILLLIFSYKQARPNGPFLAHLEAFRL